MWITSPIDTGIWRGTANELLFLNMSWIEDGWMVRNWPILLKNSFVRWVILSLGFRCEVCVPADAGFCFLFLFYSFISCFSLTFRLFQVQQADLSPGIWPFVWDFAPSQSAETRLVHRSGHVVAGDPLSICVSCGQRASRPVCVGAEYAGKLRFWRPHALHHVPLHEHCASLCAAACLDSTAPLTDMLCSRADWNYS